MLIYQCILVTIDIGATINTVYLMYRRPTFGIPHIHPRKLKLYTPRVNASSCPSVTHVWQGAWKVSVINYSCLGPGKMRPLWVGKMSKPVSISIDIPRQKRMSWRVPLFWITIFRKEFSAFEKADFPHFTTPRGRSTCNWACCWAWSAATCDIFTGLRSVWVPPQHQW